MTMAIKLVCRKCELLSSKQEATLYIAVKLFPLALARFISVKLILSVFSFFVQFSTFNYFPSYSLFPHNLVLSRCLTFFSIA